MEMERELAVRDGILSRLEFCSQLATVVGNLPSRTTLETSMRDYGAYSVEFEPLKNFADSARMQWKFFFLQIFLLSQFMLCCLIRRKVLWEKIAFVKAYRIYRIILDVKSRNISSDNLNTLLKVIFSIEQLIALYNF